MSVRSLSKSCWFVVVCLVIAIGCSRESIPPVASNDSDSNLSGEQMVEQNGGQGDTEDKSIVFDGFVIHEPVAYENLTIFPVSRVEPNMEDRFITLDEGLKNGTVEVFELGAGNGNDQPRANQGLNPSVPEGIPSADPFGDSSPAQPADPDCAPQSNEEAPDGDAPNPADDPEQASQANQTDSVQDDQEVAENQAADELAGQTGNAEDLNQQQYVENGLQWLGNQGNSVNRVYVLNRSDRPLYLMPGEIILGGDQDRTIGEEIVIAPSQEPVEVEVFCVEHGRWGGRSPERTTQELAAAINNSANAQSVAANLTLITDGNGNASLDESAQQLSEQAENGKFIASVGVLTKKARVAAQGAKDQGKVWDEVASANSSANSQIDSGAFTINYVDEENIKRFEAFVEALQDPVADIENVVGVVVAINGKIDAADVFESTPLFKKLWPKLLKSYSLEAANQAALDAVADGVDEAAEGDANEEAAIASDTVDQESQLAMCTVQDAVAFLQQAKAASETANEVKDGIAISHRSDASVDSFSLRIGSPQPSASEEGGFGGAVHFSGFSK